MSLEALAEVVADYQMALAAVATDTAEAVQAEVARLLETPEDRNAEIALDFAEAGEAQTMRETGNAELSQTLWDEIVEFGSLPMSALATIPPADRGIIWSAAASFLLATCQRQAWITHGGAVQALRIGVETAGDMRKATRGMSVETLRTANFPVKTAIRDRKVAGQNG